MRRLMTAVALALCSAAALGATRTMLKTVPSAVYSGNWSAYSGAGLWSENPAEDRLCAGYDYEAPKNCSFYFPTAVTEADVFPGDSLKMIHSDNRFMSCAPQNFTGKRLVFHVGGKEVSGASFSALYWAYAADSSAFAQDNVTRFLGPVVFECSNARNAFSCRLTSAGDRNYAKGVEFVDSWSSPANLTTAFNNDATYRAVVSFRHTFWSKFTGDMTEVLGTVNLGANTVAMLGASGFPNVALVSLPDADSDSTSTVLALSATNGVAPVKNLRLGRHTRVWAAHDAAEGTCAAMRVTGILTLMAPIHLALTENPVVMSGRTSYTYPILKIASGAMLSVTNAVGEVTELSADCFDVLGFAGFDDRTNGFTEFSGMRTKVVVETDQEGDSVVSLAFEPVTKLVVSQNRIPDDYRDGKYWSDGKTVDAEENPEVALADYDTAGLPLRINYANTHFPGKSLAIAGGTEVQYCCGDARTTFDNVGLKIENGYFNARWGDGSAYGRRVAELAGNVTVLSSPETFSFRQAEGNSGDSFALVDKVVGSFESGFTVKKPGTPSASEPWMRLGLYLGMTGDTTEFYGTVKAETNTVVGLGASYFPGTLTLENGSHLKVTESVGCSLGTLSIAENAGLELKVDPTTGAFGGVTVSNRLDIVRPVRVWLDRLPNRAVSKGIWKIPVLKLAGTATGTLSKDDFVFEGVESGENNRRQSAFVQETAPDGSQVVYYECGAGMMLMLR